MPGDRADIGGRRQFRMRDRGRLGRPLQFLKGDERRGTRRYRGAGLRRSAFEASGRGCGGSPRLLLRRRCGRSARFPSGRRTGRMAFALFLRPARHASPVSLRLPAVSHRSSAISCPPSVVSGKPSVVSHQSSVISHQSSVISRHFSYRPLINSRSSSAMLIWCHVGRP